MKPRFNAAAASEAFRGLAGIGAYLKKSGLITRSCSRW
jgi:hypothetical protein